MIQTKREWKLEQLEEVIRKKRQSGDDGCLYKPGSSGSVSLYEPEYRGDMDADRFGFPSELYSIME